MKLTKIKPLIGEDYQISHEVGDISTLSCRSCGHQLRKIAIEEIEDVTAEIRFSLKTPKNIWFGPPAALAVFCPGFTAPSLSLPGITPPKKRYSVPRTHVLRHKMTRAEQDVMVGEYKNKMLTPDKIIIKWDISPGQLYYILKKHHIDTIYKPNRRG